MNYTQSPINKLSNEIIYIIVNNIKIKDLMELKNTCKILDLIITKYKINNVDNKINIYININEYNELKIIKGGIINTNLHKNQENYIVYIKKYNDLNKILKLKIFNNEYVKDNKLIFTSKNCNMNKIIFSRYYEYILNENNIIMDFIKKDNYDYNKILEIKNDILKFIKKHNKIQKIQYNGYTDDEIDGIIDFINKYNIIIKLIKWNHNINLRILHKLIKNNKNIIINLKNNSRNRNYKIKYKNNIDIYNQKVILKENKYVLYME